MANGKLYWKKWSLCVIPSRSGKPVSLGTNLGTLFTAPNKKVLGENLQLPLDTIIYTSKLLLNVLHLWILKWVCNIFQEFTKVLGRILGFHIYVDPGPMSFFPGRYESNYWSNYT